MIRFVAIDCWDCSLDPVERLLRGSCEDGTAFSCNLSKPEYRLLARLLSEPGAAISRDELTRHAWDGRPVTAGSLSNAVFNLRQAFGPEDGRQVIRTVPNQGYRIRASLLESLEEASTPPPSKVLDMPEQALVEAPPAAATRQPKWRSWVPALAAATVANLVAALCYAYWGSSPNAAGAPHRLAYEYLADIGERRFFAQVSPQPAPERLERALKAFADYPPQAAAGKPYVYVNHGDSDDEFAYFLCQDSLEADAPNCSAYVIQRDSHS